MEKIIAYKENGICYLITGNEKRVVITLQEYERIKHNEILAFNNAL